MSKVKFQATSNFRAGGKAFSRGQVVEGLTERQVQECLACRRLTPITEKEAIEIRKDETPAKKTVAKKKAKS